MVLLVMLFGIIVGCSESKVERKAKVAERSIPQGDKGEYDEDAVTLPRYPGSVVEHSEKVFAPGGKKVSFLRVYLNTTDPYPKVRDFYRRTFRDKYGEPTEELDRGDFYHVSKAKDKKSLPYFQVEISDEGSFRRVVIMRADRNR